MQRFFDEPGPHKTYLSNGKRYWRIPTKQIDYQTRQLKTIQTNVYVTG